MSESELLRKLQIEMTMNKMIQFINNHVKDNNMKINHLTQFSGDCLYESLVYLKIGKDIDNLKRCISYMIYIFRDYKNFFPNQKESLKELFMNFNDIEFVYCKNDGRLYKYTYEIMCQDLLDTSGWTRAPTQLILMFISKIFNLNIHIINESGFEYSIYFDESSDNIYLAHLAESHYMPISKKINDDVIEYKYFYNQFQKEYNKN